MTATFRPFPDSELLATTILNAASFGSYTIADGMIGNRLPDTPTYPVIVVRRVGGVPSDRHRVDNPEIQANVWGDTKKAAQDVAALARAALFTAEGRLFSLADGTRVFLSGVEDSIGLSDLFDPLNKIPHYVFSVRFA